MMVTDLNHARQPSPHNIQCRPCPRQPGGEIDWNILRTSWLCGFRAGVELLREQIKTMTTNLAIAA
jgi:hypothetical protein